MSASASDPVMTFWDHLDVLRGALWRCVIVITVATVVAFCCKDLLFGWILAPCAPDFVTYRWLARLGGGFEGFHLQLINTELAAQFRAHIVVSLEIGLLLAAPYVLWQVFAFIAPALYARERRVAVRLFPATCVLFFVGVATNYFLLFPVALHFLGTYQVSAAVANTITLSSYVDSFTSMTLVIGLVFEVPIAVWLMGRAGLVTAHALRCHRRHALVAIMLLAAFVTPPDIFTMLLVTVPLYLLYEAGILLIR